MEMLSSSHCVAFYYSCSKWCGAAVHFKVHDAYQLDCHRCSQSDVLSFLSVSFIPPFYRSSNIASHLAASNDILPIHNASLHIQHLKNAYSSNWPRDDSSYAARQSQLAYLSCEGHFNGCYQGAGGRGSTYLTNSYDNWSLRPGSSHICSIISILGRPWPRTLSTSTYTHAGTDKGHWEVPAIIWR